MKLTKRKNSLILLLVICLILFISLMYYLSRQGKISFLAAITAPSLAVSPSSGTYNVGQTFTVKINLNTAGSSVDAVDVYSLNYNPNALEVQDANPTLEGVQIGQGTFSGNPFTYMANKVDTANGKINFSAVVTGGSPGYNSNGQDVEIANVTFKAMSAAALSPLNFNFEYGNRSETNVWEHGTANDILGSVVNGNFTLVNPTPAPTVTLKANGIDNVINLSRTKDLTLSWTTTNAATCEASGAWSGVKATSGNQNMGKLTENKNYVLTCRNSGGGGCV